MSCARRTLPGTIDAIARDDPNRTWGRFPESQEAFEQGKLVTVSFATLANSINRVAWVLDALLPERSDLDTIAYIGPSDIRYYILACAACKCRLKALFSSPRNNPAAHLSLLESSSCRTILRPREKPLDGLLQSLIKSHDIRVCDLPTLEELLSLETMNAFPWDKTYSDVANEPFVVLHTSGSTGNPKPINVKHSLIACVDAQQLLPNVGDRYVTAREWANRRLYNALPPFHAAGLNFFAYSIFQSTEFLLGPSGAPPSLTTVELVLKYDMADAGILPPSLLSEAAADANLLEMFSKWSSVIYGGGPLPQDTGDALQTKLKVLRALGSTETFNLPELLPASKDDWPYNCFHPSLGIDFRERMDGLYELVIVRQPDQAEHQGAFCTFPELEEYAMKDLYRKHPYKPNLWRYCGRLDDIIVLSNGEKFNPSDAESKITQNPDVKSALVVGTGREQPALLVEPCNKGLSDERRQCIIAEAVSANELLPTHAQIHPSHVRVLASPDTFLRSSKGEVQRAKTISALNDTIEELYATAGANTFSDLVLDLTDRERLTKSLVEIISQELLRGKPVSPDDNIFDLGLDSLQVTRLLRYVRAGIRQHDKTLGASITPRTIYQNPSATSLARTLSQLVTEECPSPAESDGGESDFQSILESYTSRLGALKRTDVIILTGSTGSLGSYFLDSLIRKRTFANIICLNRRGGNVDRQRSIHRARGLTDDLSAVQFLEAKLAEPRLGLSEHQYSTLVNEATQIFHGAWEVNFNLPMSSFKSQLDGCYRLVELAHKSIKHAAVTFVSSVGAANHWSYVYDGPVPEQALGDFAVAEPMGYAQSKLLAELLFLDASKRLAIPVTICRVGQIAGPVKSKQGAWNSSEWFPSMILTAKALGMLPDTLGAMDRIDWVPVDLLGDMLAEVVTRERSVAERSTANATSSPAAEVLHFVNPRPVRWSEIASKLALQIVPRPLIVPYGQWLQALTVASEQRSDEVASLPAMKLLDFFHDIGRGDAKRPIFSTTMTERLCPSLQECGPVSIPWVLRWVRQWGLDVGVEEFCAK